jgi:NADH:ubiquinone oxidoreductase subunit 5 (subunit L)/multisubunit Na+/H+ antiporter MnhA subunit
MYLLILYLPLISATIGGLGGRAIGSKGARILTSGLLVSTFIVSLFILYEVGFNSAPTYIKLMT